MENIHAKNLQPASKAVANQSGAAQGKSMPAVPALQKKDELADEELPAQGKSDTIQKKENTTGLPDNLKSGIENLSGMDISDVKVHYNSSQPAQLNALAYAQGSNIHIAPGQEKHLPHEAWHVVQQKQGRVQPTMQMKQGIPVNDDKGLEAEADAMGAKALQMQTLQKKTWAEPAINFKMKSSPDDVAQLKLFITGVNSNKAVTDELIDIEYAKGEPFVAALKEFVKSGTNRFASWAEAETAAKAAMAAKAAKDEALPEHEKFGDNFKLLKTDIEAVMGSLGLKSPEGFIATNTLASYAIIYTKNVIDYHISWIFDPTGQVATGVHYAVRDISPGARKKEVLYKFYKITYASGTLTAELSGSPGEGDHAILDPLMVANEIDLDDNTLLLTALGFLNKRVVPVTASKPAKKGK